jgi:hypothetical protein
MNLSLSGILVLSLLLSAAAEPGETYVLTGREKSIFSIYKADMKAYPELYKDEDINVYYSNFKTLNNLDGRKLKTGEELIFPHTKESEKIMAAAKAKAASTVKEAEAAASESQDEGLSLFGSDTRSHTPSGIPRTEAERKNARQNAVRYYQHTLLPRLLNQNDPTVLNAIEQGNIEVLVARARGKVDELFSKALVLHRYPDKEIYILEFEQPDQVGNYFFLGIKKEAYEPPRIYALEKGLSFFGAGDPSVLFERKPGGQFTKIGGRTYNDLSSFLQEMEGERPMSSDH